MPADRLLAALCLLSVVATAVAQAPPADPPAPQPRAARPPAGSSPIERIGWGQLIEADDTHIVLRVNANNVINGDTQDKRVDLRDGELLEITVDLEPAKVSDLKLPLFASVQRFRAFRGRPARLIIMATTPTVSGVLTKLTPPTFTMTSGRDQKEIVVTTDENTRVMVALPDPKRPNVRAGTKATVADLQVGMQISVTPPTGVATFVTGTVPVSDAERAAAEAMRPVKDDLFYGIVVKTEGNTVRVLTNKHGEMSFDTDGSTRITLDSRVVLLEELKPEMDVVVRRSAKTAKADARTLRVTATSEQVWGSIKSFDGSTLTLLQPHRISPPSDLAVTLDDGVTVETFVDYPEKTKPGTRADLVVGREAKLIRRDGKFAVVSVFTGTPRPVPSATQPTTQP